MSPGMSSGLVLLGCILCSSLYLSSPFPRTPLHAAAFADNIHGLQLLLRHQAEVDTTDKLGRTPLMMASENGHTAAVGTWSAANPFPRHCQLSGGCHHTALLPTSCSSAWDLSGGNGGICCLGTAVLSAVPGTVSHTNTAVFPSMGCETPLLPLGSFRARLCRSGHSVCGFCPHCRGLSFSF